MGKMIITTSLGKEGIEGKDKEDFLVADSEEQFVEAIQLCVEQQEAAKTIAKKAQENARQQFDTSLAAKKIMDIYQTLLGYEGRTSGKTTVSTLIP